MPQEPGRTPTFLTREKKKKHVCEFCGKDDFHSRQSLSYHRLKICDKRPQEPVKLSEIMEKPPEPGPVNPPDPMLQPPQDTPAPPGRPDPDPDTSPDPIVDAAPEIEPEIHPLEFPVLLTMLLLFLFGVIFIIIVFHDKLLEWSKKLFGRIEHA